MFVEILKQESEATDKHRSRKKNLNDPGLIFSAFFSAFLCDLCGELNLKGASNFWLW
jgi:hypothetical protein